MKHILLFIVFLPLFTIAQNKAFKAKLIDYSKDKMTPACGKSAFATTLKFELKEDVDSLKMGQKILVIITCPSDIGIKYKNNNDYSIILCNTAETKVKEIYHWPMVYKYENEKLPRFWCQKIEKIKVVYY